MDSMKKAGLISRCVSVSFFLLAISCARAPIQTATQSMRPYSKKLVWQDDLSYESLLYAIKSNAEFLEKSNKKDAALVFGPKSVRQKEYADALKMVLGLADGKTKEEFLQLLSEYFEPMQVYGQSSWGEVFITAYYEPVMKGSREKTVRFSQPIYGYPKDMVIIHFGDFIESLPHIRNKVKTDVFEQKSQKQILRGRMVSNGSGRTSIYPFYSREEIDKENSPLTTSEILAWVEPLDSFFLQIQGSGTIEFNDGKSLRVGYTAQNGHPYVPIGKYLFDVIPKEDMSMQSIKGYLKTLPTEEQQKILNHNPSYVFFESLKGKPLTFMGTEVNPGRTIATDYNFFPKGALCLLEYQKPLFESESDNKPSDWVNSSRLVIDQDTGGAIRGPGRVDLYWGKGPEAEQAAGVMKKLGKLFYLVPSDRTLELVRQLKGNTLP